MNLCDPNLFCYLVFENFYDLTTEMDSFGDPNDAAMDGESCVLILVWKFVHFNRRKNVKW